MSKNTRRIPSAVRAPATANDRLKSRWRPILWSATTLGVAAHAAVLFALPDVQVDVGGSPPSATPAQLLQLVSVADIEFRDFTEAAIAVPAIPRMDPLDLDIELETPLELPDFSEFAEVDQNLVPPIRTTRDEWLDYKAFAPYVVRPEIRNRAELKQFLQRHYQRIFEYSGATGVVQVSFWIDEAGAVQKAEILKSSGVRSLDRLALRLSRVLRFRPAMMAGRPIRILVHVPITFRAA